VVGRKDVAMRQAQSLFRVKGAGDLSREGYYADLVLVEPESAPPGFSDGKNVLV